MIVIPSTHELSPDTRVGVQVTADMLTGDGIFANTILMRVQRRGWAIINVVGDNVAHELYVPQEKHRDNIPNYPPVLRSGIAPDEWNMVNYKVPLHAGDSLFTYIDLNTGTAAYALGELFELDKNGRCPVADHTPDIVVSKPITATTQNALIDTDLEDIAYSGWMYTWFVSNQIDSQIVVNQRNQKPNKYSLAGSDGTGTSCQCSYESAYKTWIGKTDTPSIAITEVTGMAAFLVVAFFIRDKRYKPFGR